MGPTGPSARRAPYFFFFAIVSPPSAPRVPRLARSWGRLYGEPAKSVKEKILSGGGFRAEATISGDGVALLANRRRFAVLATAHELLVQRHALLAHRTLLGRIRGEVAAHEA